MNLTIGGLGITIKSGALIPVLLMLPNVTWLLSSKAEAGGQASVPIFLTILENVGRALVLIVQFFCALDMKKEFLSLVAGLMALALIIYYSAWLRYFLGGGAAELFRPSLLGIPFR